MQDGKKRRLRYRYLLVLCALGERRDVDPNQLAGFFLWRTLQQNARFVGRPLKRAHADPQARDLAEIYKITDFENFFVHEVGNFLCAGRNSDAALVAVKRGKFSVVLREQLEPLQP